MKREALLRSILHGATRRVARIFGVFSKVLFWFSLCVVAYLAILGHDLLDGRYAQQGWWHDFYSIASAFLIGGLVSFLFYFLVVYIPERRKRRMIKGNLRRLYADIKRDILYQVIFASQKGGRCDLSADSETVERLLTVGGFNAAFEGGREAHQGFYAFRNYISEDVHEYRAIIRNLEVLSKQIDYILHNYSFSNESMFNFFKRLDAFLFSFKGNSLFR